MNFFSAAPFRVNRPGDAHSQGTPRYCPQREFQPRREADRQRGLVQAAEGLGHLVAGHVQVTAASVQALEPSQRSVDKSVALLFEKAGLDVGQFQSVTGSSD
tara:strand:- start:57 stop:362 length:306 start_codon:yes stop_codon:yes gene_type:complete